MAVRPEIRIVAVLAACQGLVQTGLVMMIMAGGLAGYILAPDKALATLPISFLMIGTMVTTIPASLFMGRFGRRAGFWLGSLSGAFSATLAVTSLLNGWFWMFCFAHLFYGGYQGFGQYYRFAAAEAATAAFRSRAISYVLIGSAAAAVAGPNLVAFTRDLGATIPFVATYGSIIVLSMAGTAMVSLIQLAKPVEAAAEIPPRPIGTVVRQPTFLVAMLGAAGAFGVMNLAMTATPLAMIQHEHGIGETALVFQSHSLGMFLPSFFTGVLIARFGAPQVMLVGATLLLGHVAIALSGAEFLQFVSALVLLGVGWNFSYLGGTALLTETYRSSEKAWAQGINDFAVSTSLVVASFASGALLDTVGWKGVNLVALPILATMGAVLISYVIWRRARPSIASTGV
jgi:MFS family permease